MASADLTWLLVKDSNCFLVKRPGVQFTREPYNLRNINSYKYSGLANEKAVDISAGTGPRKSIVVSTKKTKSGANHPGKSIHKTTLRAGSRRGQKTINNIVAAHGYRPDLRTDALARFSALNNPQKVHQRPTKVRGKKASVVRADTTGEEVD